MYSYTWMGRLVPATNTAQHSRRLTPLFLSALCIHVWLSLQFALLRSLELPRTNRAYVNVDSVTFQTIAVLVDFSTVLSVRRNRGV